MSDQDDLEPGNPGHPDGGTAAPGAGSVGSVGEEAAKLLGAVSEWARDQGSGVGQGLDGLVRQAAASVDDLNEHLATGSAECTYCPVCRAVHAVRGTSPEVRAHLVTAASSFLQAAAALLATQVPHDDRSRGASVEHIDLDEEAPDAPGEPGVGG